jgi:hypothetical protein
VAAHLVLTIPVSHVLESKVGNVVVVKLEKSKSSNLRYD